MRTESIRTAGWAVVVVWLVACSSSTPSGGADAGTPADAAVDPPADASLDVATSAPQACAGLAFAASCQSKDICFDMFGVPEATTKAACPSAVGTVQSTPCTTTGHVGGCERTGTPAPGGCMMQWYFAPTFKVETIKRDCAVPATYRAP